MNNIQEVIAGLTFAPYGEHDTAITINQGDFKGITFKFGRTWFPDPDVALLSFEYDIIGDNHPKEKLLADFRYLLGNILHVQLVKAIESQGVVYSGGTGPVEVVEGDGDEYQEVEPLVFREPPVMQAVKSKIMLPEDYKVPTPEAGTRMSRNLLSGL
jgi:hypothetical protein